MTLSVTGSLIALPFVDTWQQIAPPPLRIQDKIKSFLTHSVDFSRFFIDLASLMFKTLSFTWETTPVKVLSGSGTSFTCMTPKRLSYNFSKQSYFVTLQASLQMVVIVSSRGKFVSICLGRYGPRCVFRVFFFAGSWAF